MTNTIALDTETFPIEPGLAAPPMVCTSVSDGRVLHVRDGRCRVLWRRSLENDVLVGQNFCFDMAVVLHTYPSLAGRIFNAYEEGRIHCTKVMARTVGIANGELGGRWIAGKYKRNSYSLAALSERYLGRKVEKGEDTWRLRYGELYNVCVAEWPKEAVRYAALDAELVALIYPQLLATGHVADHAANAYANFALYLMTCRGIVTDAATCKRLIKATEREIERCRDLCEKHGLIVNGVKKIVEARKRLLERSGINPKEVRKAVTEYQAQKEAFSSKLRMQLAMRLETSEDDVLDRIEAIERDVKAGVSVDQLRERHPHYRELRSLTRREAAFAVKLEDGTKVSVTPKGQVKVDAAACRESHDEVLKAYATYASASGLRKKAARMLQGASVPLQTTYEVPIETGRTSSRASAAPLISDNFQNFARSGIVTDLGDELPGQRECVVARPGYVLCSIDFDGIEMVTWSDFAYQLLGQKDTVLGKTLMDGLNPHVALAAGSILHIPYETALAAKKSGQPADIAKACQYAKIPNYTLLGGGGVASMVASARDQGIELSETEAAELKEAFHRQWPEVKLVQKSMREQVHTRFSHPSIPMERYLSRYAQACNHPFQAIAARGAKKAATAVARAQYATGELAGAHTLLFLHDELVIELPEEYASEYAHRAAAIMRAAFDSVLVRMRCSASPAIMKVWYKGAQAVYHRSRLDNDGNRQLMVYTQ